MEKIYTKTNMRHAKLIQNYFENGFGHSEMPDNKNGKKLFQFVVLSIFRLLAFFGDLRFRRKSQSFIFNYYAPAMRAFALGLLTLFSGVMDSDAQNAIPGQDKYFMLVGELTGNSTSRTDVYQFTTGGGILNCGLSGGGGEGMVMDPTKSIAYIATCCSQGEIRVYDYSTASFKTPIPIPGEDILDVSISSDYAFLFASTYNKLYKISTSTNSIVASFAKTSLVNSTTKDFWGSAVQSSSGKIYVTTNWQINSGTSTIESLNASLTGGSTLIATAPSGFHFRGVIFDNSGNLWAVAANDNSNTPDKIFKYTSTGTLINSYNFPTPSSRTGQIYTGKVDPYDIAFDYDGKLYITTFAGDCVTKFDPSNGGFATYLQYVAGASAKSIAFVGGNFKCECATQVVNSGNINITPASCNGSTPNQNASATINSLVYNSSEVTKADIKKAQLMDRLLFLVLQPIILLVQGKLP